MLAFTLCWQPLWFDDACHVIIFIQDIHTRLASCEAPLAPWGEALQDLNYLTRFDQRCGLALVPINVDFTTPASTLGTYNRSGGAMDEALILMVSRCYHSKMQIFATQAKLLIARSYTCPKYAM